MIACVVFCFEIAIEVCRYPFQYGGTGHARMPGNLLELADAGLRKNVADGFLVGTSVLRSEDPRKMLEELLLACS